MLIFCIFRVSAFELDLVLVNNTGLIVSLGGGRVISPTNLTFLASNLGPDAEIKLEIISGPNYGKERGSDLSILTRINPCFFIYH